MPKSLLTSTIHKKDRNRRPSLSSTQHHKITSPKILPTGPNGIPAFVLKRTLPQAIKHNNTKYPFQARSLPARTSVSAPSHHNNTKEEDDDASSTAGSDMEIDIEALDDDDTLTAYSFRKPRRRPSESTVTPASSYADVSTAPPPAPTTKTVSAQELAEIYLSALLSATPGALPIRRINAHLVEMVPSFAALPPPKQRRLVVKALEGRKGELFEKVSWGTWSYIGHNSPNTAASAPGNMSFQHVKKMHKKSEKMEDPSYPVLFSFDNDMDSSSEESDWSAGDDDTDEEDWRAIGAAGILERCARRESQSRMQGLEMRREISRDDEDAAIEALVRMSESY
jgi:Putative Sin3 binding protein